MSSIQNDTVVTSANGEIQDFTSAELSGDELNSIDKKLDEQYLLNGGDKETTEKTNLETETLNEDPILNTVETTEIHTENSETIVLDTPSISENLATTQIPTTLQTQPPSSTSDASPIKSTPTKNNCNSSNKVTVYNVKWIEFNHKTLPIVTQNENGPCPLLAIMNFLFLQQRASLSHSKKVVESPELTTLLANCILEHSFSRTDASMQENVEQQVNDAISMIPCLTTGLDVNVRFTGVKDFEYTSHIEIFNLLSIPLLHGWLVEPELVAVREVIKDYSYNQLVVKVVNERSSENSSLVQEALIAEEFLDSTASQLTYHGLCELSAGLQHQEMGVFFRNNHFLTIIKHIDSLYVLATDQGFLEEARVVWESLSNIEGDSHFYDSNFKLFRPTSNATAAALTTPTTPTTTTTATTATASKDSAMQVPLSEEQINNDYLMALSLQQDEQEPVSAMTDEELARSLQLQEEQRLQAREGARTPDGSDVGRRKKGRREAAATSTAASSSSSHQVTTAAATPPGQSVSSPSILKSVKENCVVM